MLPEKPRLGPKRIQQPLAKLLEIRLPIRRRGQTVGEQMQRHLPPPCADSSSGDFPAESEPRPNAEAKTIADRQFSTL